MIDSISSFTTEVRLEVPCSSLARTQPYHITHKIQVRSHCSFSTSLSGASYSTCNSITPRNSKSKAGQATTRAIPSSASLMDKMPQTPKHHVPPICAYVWCRIHDPGTPSLKPQTRLKSSKLQCQTLRSLRIHRSKPARTMKTRKDAG